MCFDTDSVWTANLSTSCSPVFKRQLVNLNTHTTSPVSLSISVCVGDSLRSTGCSLLSPWEWLYHSSSVSLHYHSGRSSRYENSPRRSTHTHAGACLLYFTQKPLRLPVIIHSAKLHCSQPVVSLCSSGHLACYSLIYLWLSVIGRLYDWISLSYCCLLSLHATSLSPAVCFYEPLTHSLWFIHWVHSYLCKSFIVSLFSALLLFSHTQKLSPTVSQSHFLHLLSTTFSLYFVCFLDHQLLNVFPHMLYFLFLPFTCSPICSDSL